jgi:hypothetical protein
LESLINLPTRLSSSRSLACSLLPKSPHLWQTGSVCPSSLVNNRLQWYGAILVALVVSNLQANQPENVGPLIVVRPMHVQTLCMYTATKLKVFYHPKHACLTPAMLLSNRID